MFHQAALVARGGGIQSQGDLRDGGQSRGDTAKMWEREIREVERKGELDGQAVVTVR